MRVLISAVSRFTTPTGLCRHSANLAACLSERPEIDQITFVIGSWQSYYRGLLGVQHPKVELLAIKIANRSLERNRWFYVGLPKAAEASRAEIVHLSFPVPIRGGRFRYKTAVTLHDLYPYDCPEVFGYPHVLFNRMFLSNCLRNVDAIACVSAVTQTRLRALFPREAGRSCVIPNTVVPDQSSPVAPDNWSMQPFVLVVSQHRRNKNLQLAVRGFAELRRRGVVPSGTRLVIVGAAGPETKSLMAAIQSEGLGDDTNLLSAVPDACLNWLYSNCLLLFITSTIEGFCLPLIEGLRFGARIVCSDIPILREIGQNYCEFFPVEAPSTEALVSAAKRTLSMPKQASPDLERFSPHRAGASYTQLYEALTDRPLLPRTAVLVNKSQT